MSRFFTFYDQNREAVFQGYFTGVFDALDFAEINDLNSTYIEWE